MQNARLSYQPIIGLEVHVELKTASKMFCGCPNDWFGKEPNTQTCPVCLGLPGALPMPNKKAIDWCLKLGMASNCTIAEFSKFDRKNYFYPDLPKGYQISQYDQPFAVDGRLQVGKKTIRIRRVHLEEDTGKLVHATVEGKNVTLIDFNRSGVPLVEIVTGPDIHSSEEAVVFLKKLHQIIRYLGISNADMEKGSMRLEPNISVRNVKVQISNVKTKSQNLNSLQDNLPTYKVEVKNINSFNFAKKAIDYEVKRQIEVIEQGETPNQETRGWDENKGVTYSQRLKEEAHDYRYFPEPDIPPFRLTKDYLKQIRATIGELPEHKIDRFMRDFSLNEYDASHLVDTAQKAEYFERCVKFGKEHTLTPKTIANWIINKKIDLAKVEPMMLIETIVKETTKEELPERELKKIIIEILKQNQKAVTDYKKGKQQVLMFLVGQVMRDAKGKANPEKLKLLILQLLP